MDSDDDCNELYGDLDVYVNAGILRTQESGGKAAPLVDASSPTDLEDMSVPHNSVDSTVGCSNPVSAAGGGCEEEKKDEEEEEGSGTDGRNDAMGSGRPLPSNQFEHAGFSVAGEHFTSPFYGNTCFSSWSWGHDWDINHMGHVISPSMPSMMNNGFDFFHSQNDAIFGRGVEYFEKNSWRDPTNNVGFFNHGLNEQSRKHYRGTQVLESKGVCGAYSQKARPCSVDRTMSIIKPKGRFIQVESGNGERRSSMDVKRFRIRDSDAVIQVKVEGSVEDISPATSKDLASACSLDVLEGNANSNRAVNLSKKVDGVSVNRGGENCFGTIDNAGFTSHRMEINTSANASEEFGRSKSHEDNCIYSSNEAVSLLEYRPYVLTKHDESPSYLGDCSDAVDGKMDGSHSPKELSYAPEYVHGVSANFVDGSLSDSLYGEGTLGSGSAEDHLEHQFYGVEHNRSSKISYEAIGKAAVYNSHASNHVHNYSKKINSSKEHMDEVSNKYKLYGVEHNRSSKICHEAIGKAVVCNNHASNHVHNDSKKINSLKKHMDEGRNKYKVYGVEHNRSSKISHEAIGKTAVYNSHASNHAHNDSKKINSSKAHMDEGSNKYRLYDRRGHLSSRIERRLPFSYRHKSPRENVTRYSSTRHFEREGNPKKCFTGSSINRGYSPARRSSKYGYSTHMQSCLNGRNARERRNTCIEDRLKRTLVKEATSKSDWDPSSKMKSEVGRDARMKVSHEDDFEYRHTKTIIGSRKSDAIFLNQEELNPDACKENIHGSVNDCTIVVTNLSSDLKGNSKNDAVHKSDKFRSTTHYKYFQEKDNYSLVPIHTNCVQHLKEDYVEPASSGLACAKSSNGDFSSDRRELDFQFDDAHGFMMDSFPKNNLSKQLDFSSIVSVLRHDEDEVHSSELSNSGRISRYNASHECSILDETFSFQGPYYLDSCTGEKIKNSACRERKNALGYGKEAGRYSSERKGSTDTNLQTESKMGGSVDEFNAEEIHNRKILKDDYPYAVHSYVDKEEMHDSSAFLPETNEQQLVKYMPSENPNNSELEEGQLIEDSEEICSASNNDMRTQSIEVNQHNLDKKMENQQEDGSTWGDLHKINDSVMYESVEKIRKRVEKFKKPITAKKNLGSEQEVFLPVGSEACEFLKSRPARKRRWGDG